MLVRKSILLSLAVLGLTAFMSSFAVQASDDSQTLSERISERVIRRR